MFGECESCLAKFVCPNCSNHAKDAAATLRELREQTYRDKDRIKELEDENRLLKSRITSLTWESPSRRDYEMGDL